MGAAGLLSRSTPWWSTSIVVGRGGTHESHEPIEEEQGLLSVQGGGAGGEHGDRPAVLFESFGGGEGVGGEHQPSMNRTGVR